MTSCLCPVGHGRWIQTAGGWSDAQDQLKALRGRETREDGGAKSKTESAKPKPKTKLSFKDEHRQKEINELIPKLQAEIAALEKALADPDLYTRDAAAFNAKSARIGAAREEMDEAELEWLEIEEKREGLGG